MSGGKWWAGRATKVLFLSRTHLLKNFVRTCHSFIFFVLVEAKHRAISYDESWMKYDQSYLCLGSRYLYLRCGPPIQGGGLKVRLSEPIPRGRLDTRSKREWGADSGSSPVRKCAAPLSSLLLLSGVTVSGSAALFLATWHWRICLAPPRFGLWNLKIGILGHEDTMVILRASADTSPVRVCASNDIFEMG